MGDYEREPVPRADMLGQDADWHRRLDLGRVARLKAKLLEYDCAAGVVLRSR